MVGSCYKVIEKFEPRAAHQPHEEYLCAEVGDILVECERVDDYWFRGRSIVKQTSGRIPQFCVDACSTLQTSKDGGAKRSLLSVARLLSRDGSDLTCGPSNKILSALGENPLAATRDERPSESRCGISPALTPLHEASDTSCAACDLNSDIACLRSSSVEPSSADMSAGNTTNDFRASVLSSATVCSDSSLADDHDTAFLPVSKFPSQVPHLPSHPPQRRRGQRKFSSFRSGTSDEGYSGSLHSGEVSIRHHLLAGGERSLAPSCDDSEGGYEVPVLKVDDSHGRTVNRVEAGSRGKAQRVSCKGRRRAATGDKWNGSEEGGYYAPTTKLRDSSFIASDDSNSLMLRMLVCFSAALVLSLAFCVVLLLVADVHPVLCFSVGAVVFVVTWIAPVTLLNRGFACVVVLMIPSLFSSKVKAGIFVLLAVNLLTGPVFGVIDKLSLAASCKSLLQRGQSLSNVPVTDQNVIRFAAPLKSGQPTASGNSRFVDSTTAAPLASEAAEEGTASQLCHSSFDRVLYFCSKVHERFVQICRAQSSSDLVKGKALCLKPVDHFCGTKYRVVRICTGSRQSSVSPSTPGEQEWNASALEAMDGSIIRSRVAPSSGIEAVRATADAGTRRARTVLWCLLPLLLFLLVHEAYSYNKDFQTTKDTDNVYVTAQLKDIDLQRKLRGLSDQIFPLTRLEFSTNLVRRSISLSKREKQRLFCWMLAWAVTLLICLLVVALEDFVDEAVRVTDFTKCAADYNQYKSSRSASAVYAIIASTFLLILLQSYVLRLRSKVCSVFYPKRENIRAMHLYYRILHDRVVFNRRCRRRVQIRAEEKRMSQEASFRTRLYRCLPTFLCRVFDFLSVHRCMICLSRGFTRTVTCPNNSCQASFCFDCYVDSGQKCVACSSSTNPGSSMATATV